MLYEINFFIADIQNKFYEAGVLKDCEKVIFTIGSNAVLENFTGKNYSYRRVNIHDHNSRFIFSRQTPLPPDKYVQTAEKLLQSEEDYLPYSETNITKNKRAINLLSHIFINILPLYGMSFRNEQYTLAIEILQGLQNNKLMLCEAEVGTGKTHAYILAVMIYNLFSDSKLPTVISTSTIALQKALTEEYIPQISNILMEHRITDKPLSFVVRKGKSHYACDDRLKTYYSSIRNNDNSEEQGLLNILIELSEGYRIDLDNCPLTPYVKNRICVADCNANCSHSDMCRFMDFTKMCLIAPWDFQIANHNFVLADILNRKNGRKLLLPDTGIRIFDEAHKLSDAARQMYGVTFFDNLIPELSKYAVPDEKDSRKGSADILQLCFELVRRNKELFKGLNTDEQESSRRTVNFTTKIINQINALISRLQRLSEFFYTLNQTNAKRYKSIRHSCNRISEMLKIFLNHDLYICWWEKSDNGRCALCAIPKALNELLYTDIWHSSLPCVLTSGTMSVGGDFNSYKLQNGIEFVNSDRIFETSKPSPFDYKRNALLYIPNHMPFPNSKNEKYIKAIINQISQLILKIHGHTLILFTSYRLMERVFYSMEQSGLPFPTFVMKRGRLDVLAEFRTSGNGILFAGDSAGEGIDLAGDILSGLIVVKLPFPVPDPITEYERSLYDDMDGYLQEVIVPSMLIKLRQWIGRGIRREDDTAVFAILDSRAGICGRYRKDVLDALPDMTVTDDVDDVGEFIRMKKDKNYFL